MNVALRLRRACGTRLRGRRDRARAAATAARPHRGRDAASFAEDWRAHFAAAYRSQLQAFVDSVRTGVPAGASAWDGYAATATAAACLAALEREGPAAVRLEPRPAFYG